MNITFARKDSTTNAILADGIEVGYITRHDEEEARMIAGTTLRYAKGRKATRYSYTLARRNFVNAPLTIGSGAMPIRSLGTAKAMAADELATLTLKAAAA